VEIVAHRVIWSFVLLAVILVATRGWSHVRTILASRKALIGLAVAAAFLTANWGTYVYSVSTNQVVEGSLGYFINPLVSVALGMIFLRERLGRLQWVAIALAVIAVVELTWSYGQVPWIGLILGFSFGIYGLLKKLVGAKAMPAMVVETGMILPVALVVLLSAEATGQAAFIQDGWGIAILLVLLGPVTAIPLLAFNGAATRIPLSVLGILQYLTPSSIFLLGVFVFDEPMVPTRWLGFGLIWIALVVFGYDAWRSARSDRGNPVSRTLQVAEPD